MHNDNLSPVQHFDTLKSKYQATKYENSSPASFLYFILRKADIRIELNSFEWDWLLEQNLSETIEVIKEQEQYRAKEISYLQTEFSQLKSKYQIPLLSNSISSSWQQRVIEILPQENKFNYLKQELNILNILNPLYSIVSKLNAENQLTISELEWLQQNNFRKVAKAAEMTSNFTRLKIKFKATKSKELSIHSHLYQILKKLDVAEPLNNTDIKWLKENQLLETLEVYQQQEQAEEAKFYNLKIKYKAIKHTESSVSCPLYPILQKLDADNLLNNSEVEWLRKHELTETIAIAEELEQKHHFAQLKVKYKATQFEDTSPSSHLYKIFKKLELNIGILESDTNFLRKRKLTDTLSIALDKYAANLQLKVASGEQLSENDLEWLKKNERENIIILGQAQHFATLKSKYHVSNYKDKSPKSNLYAILQKLEKFERLEPTDIAWLEENKTEGYYSYGWADDQSYGEHKLFSGKIFTTYHKVEATFYEQEYKRTGNKWNLPNASSHWRKADEPKRALQLTEDLNFEQIKENKLKSALLTTRGGAFRDLKKLDKAEDCAKKAIEYQPNSHHPYTLMGAICYEQGRYPEGDRWFEEAIKRGASPRDQDAEIKRVVKNTKDKNKLQAVVEYLLKKDSRRYAWAKSYLNTNKR